MLVVLVVMVILLVVMVVLLVVIVILLVVIVISLVVVCWLSRSGCHLFMFEGRLYKKIKNYLFLLL